MLRSLQDLLKFADQFRKIAVDIEQPPEFEEDYAKWLKMKDKGPITVREIKTLIPPSPDSEDILPEVEDDLAKIKNKYDLPFMLELETDDNDAKLGLSDHPHFKVDEEDIKKEHDKPKCRVCHGIGYKDGEFCKNCQGSGRGKEEKEDKLKEKTATTQLILMAKKQEKKHKLDPKAEVRNRGTVCVPASQAKDDKDHFPINNIDQARNALARVHRYSSVPSWYKGSLKGLQDLVSRKVHSKYPAIGKADKKKKSSVENLMAKYGG